VRSPSKRREHLPELLAQASPGELAALADLARYHRVAGLVYRSLQEAGCQGGPVVTLRAGYHNAAASHLVVSSELGTVAQLLGDLPYPWLVVKGPALAELAYGDVGLRQYGDLDLLTSTAGFGPALEAIEHAGGKLLEANWPLMRRMRRGEVMLRLPHGGLGDLHWDLVCDSSQRARFAVQTDELLERGVPAQLSGVDVRILEPSDQVLHLCLHGAMSGGHHLVWLKDIERAVASSPPDWDELVGRARRYRLGLVCALMLLRARDVTGAEVPPAVIEALAPGRLLPGWWAYGQKRTGDARWARTRRTGRTFMAATAAGTGATLVAYAGRLARELSWNGERRHLAEGHAALFEVRDGGEDRRRYLEAITPGE
jgi:hypothetical protein